LKKIKVKSTAKKIVKDAPRYRAIKQFERELKNAYAEALGGALTEMTQKMNKFL
jgi:hypothetical protein